MTIGRTCRSLLWAATALLAASCGAPEDHSDKPMPVTPEAKQAAADACRSRFQPADQDFRDCIRQIPYDGDLARTH